MASSTLSRSIRAVRSTLLTPLRGSRSFSSTRSITSSSHLTRCLASTPSLLRPSPPSFVQLSQQRFYVRRDGPGRSSQERPPTEMAPLFPGCDYNHWLIVMDKPGGEGASKEQMIDCYVQTLSKVLGSEEEAKQKIYNVSCERYFGFGCAIDEETSNKLEGLPDVLFVLPDSYVDAEYQDYGAELFQNGQIVPRPPERQRRINEFTQPNRDNNRPRYNDRTRHARRRENMR